MADLIPDPMRAARLILSLRRQGITDDGVLTSLETVDRGVFMVQDRHRDLRPVMPRRNDPPRHVVGRIVAGGNFLRFAQGAFARDDIVVEHLARGGHGRVRKSKRRCIEFVAALKAEGIGFFIKCDGVFAVRRQVPNDNAR